MKSAGRVAINTRLSSQHLRKARKIPVMLVADVLNNKQIFSPVAVSMAVILLVTLVTTLCGSFSSNHSISCWRRAE